jgi:hypothetical protein
MASNDKQTGGFNPDELAERQGYVDWIVWWWHECIGQDRNHYSAELRDLLSHQPTIELAKLAISAQRDIFSSNIRWGSENIASASPEQREAVIDAIVRQDTTRLHDGSELPPVPTAGGCHSEASLFWARARREHLNRLSPEELATECRKMLEVETESATRRNDFMGMARLYTSRRMSALVSSRYSYRPSLIEAAKYCREHKVLAKRASVWLTKHPFECVDGNVVTFQGDRFVVKQGDQVLGGVTEGHFRKLYWPLGKIPPTS